MSRTRRLFALLVALAFAGVSLGQIGAAQSGGLYPDLRTVVPKHLNIQNTGQREFLRFSNGIANTGPGNLQFRAEAPNARVTNAIQEILDAEGNVVDSFIASTFAFHPAHNHWHIGNVAQFEVRYALDDGTSGQTGDLVVNDRGLAQSLKTTFCLIDLYKLDDNARTKERTYWECNGDLQGIASGWVDQYHQSTEGQELDITGAAPGIYYLVSTANPDGLFGELDSGNNTAWVSFELRRDSKGNPKIFEIAHSTCDSPGLCGEQSTNR
jgi:hypothetical protein